MIGNRAMQVGDYVQSGQRLASLVPLDAVYIDANFKETQLARIQPGQPVAIAVDALPGRAIEGTVASVAPASGSVFSLLPPDNATGNFTKIVQRAAGAHPRAARRRRASGMLRPGMSVVVSVDTRDQPADGLPVVRHAADRASRRLAMSARSASLTLPPTLPASVGAVAAGADDAIDPRRLVAFLAMVFGMFMAILDIQIVSASLTEIQAGLAASSDEISWVQTAYLIAEVVMIPLSGFLSRALGTRALFAISAAGFTAASLMCGLSTSINEMIVWRAIQGFIGGGMIPTVFATAFTIFPRSRRRHDLAADRPRRDAGADHRPDGRRLSHRCVLLALAVLHQRRARHRGHRRGAGC